MLKLYKKLIMEQIDKCTDADLLDLVWKLLAHENKEAEEASAAIRLVVREERAA